AAINIDMVLQNVCKLADNRTDISFTCPREDGAHAVKLLKGMQETGDWQNVLYDDQAGKVSHVCACMKSHRGGTAHLTEALRDANVNIELISTSEIRISVLIREHDVDKAVTALHDRFQLGGDEEATVYAGTGR